jgi:hypothetical protein
MENTFQLLLCTWLLGHVGQAMNAGSYQVVLL